MANRGLLILGSILIVLGIFFMLGTIFRIDVGALCCPIGLILAGVAVIFRPGLSRMGAGPSDLILIGDRKKKGPWQVQDSEYWMGVGDLDLDFTHALIPEGDTRIRVYGFVADIDFILPADVGVALDGSGFVVNSNLFGHKEENIFSPVTSRSENYMSAARRITLEFVGFVVELKVKRL